MRRMAAANVRPPLFIGEDYAYDFFESVEAALGYIEPWFPRAVPDYRAYDSAGHQLRLVVTSDDARRGQRSEGLRLEVANTTDGSADAARLLRGFLRAAGAEPDAGLDYSTLMSTAIAQAGFTT